MSENTGAAPSNAAPSAPAESGAQVENSTAGQVAQAPADNSGAQSAQVDAIQDAVDSGEISQAEANKMIKKLELKVRGKTITKEIDFSNEDELRNMAQLAEVSKLSMQEKAELEKRFEQILQNGKQDPMDFIAKLYGIDPDELAAMHIEKKIEHLKKSPEVLEKERIEAELKAAREEAKKLKEEKEMAELTKLQQEQLTSLQSEISSAIKAHTKLPDTKYVQQKMANTMLWEANNGFEDVTAEDVAPLVEEEMRKELNALFDQMPEDALEAYAGRKNIERLRKSKIAKAKEVPSVNAVKPVAANVAQEPKKPSSPSIDSKKFWRGR
jgi:hypothetical protein